MPETKGVKCVSVVHAGIHEEPNAKKTREIGVNTEHTEIGSTEYTEKPGRMASRANTLEA